MNIPEDLMKYVKAYLVGPAADNEVINDRPNEHYVLGILFPAGARSTPEDFDTPDSSGGGKHSGEHGSTGAGHGSDDAPEREQVPYRLPSSIGIMCRIADVAAKITATASFATYEKTELGWKRNPVSQTLVVTGTGEEDIINSNGETLAKLTWITGGGDKPTVSATMSVFLSNAMEEYNGRGPGSRDARCERMIFQASIRLDSKRGSFVDSGTTLDRRALMPDEVPLEMLYRERKVYARGYGCAANWDRRGTYPQFIFTETVPHYQSKRIDYELEGDSLLPNPINMVDVDKAESPQALYDLLHDISKKYHRWIVHEESQAKEINNDDFKDALTENVRKCKNAMNRIIDGLEMLRDPANHDVYVAFKAANHAMLLQRLRYREAVRRSKTGIKTSKYLEVADSDKNTWRPFQMAFLLMSLRGIADPESDKGRIDRSTADLLWFPTGGGKTEAYSALAAFAMILRRLRRGNSDGAGVSVIMRYTLRLLTIQQFERAATLICALEHMRRLDPNTLGDEPFLIGLWVGSKLTPNNPENSSEAISGTGNLERSGSPSQLVFCPWCGHDMSTANYCVDKKRTKWTIARCLDPGCDFYSRDPLDIKRALPILTVDHDIYRRCPSMIIATVDKFARLPWKAESSSLFGIVERHCDRCGYLTRGSRHEETWHYESDGKVVVQNAARLDPPDLIIQDELHLITGPLGTMVGLYETVVDYLCSFAAPGGRHPKIVASTATIKGAEEQISRLFNVKDTCVFPSPVARPDNMFFWWESEADGRLYVGTSFSHRSSKFAFARLCAALLQRVHEINDDNSIADAVEPYWTLVAYFNSIRELGSAARLAEDDILENIKTLSKRSGNTQRKMSDTVEITGNVDGQRIRLIRKRLELDSTSDESIDMLLATNMISVGIDLNRLGLMTVAGQPKSVSEYIQATGRIGRRKGIPGAVFTMFNRYKPRDLSQYEDFVGDHSRLQQAVEPAALTPFSDPAVNRAIHAVFIAMIRHTIPGMSNNCDAEKLNQYEKEINGIKLAIIDRFASVENIDKNNIKCTQLMGTLDKFTENWGMHIKKAHGESNSVCYSDDSWDGAQGGPKRNKLVLMRDFATGRQDYHELPRPTPGSLRDVEAMAGLFYDRVTGGAS